MYDHRAQSGRLIRGAAQLGMALTSSQVGQFVRYAELLEEWNERLNLTRVQPCDFLSLHFLDSLTIGQVVPLPGSGTSRPTLLDLGTGAGLPGIALKIAFPSLDVTLLDSTRKKLAFLDVVIEDLGLSGVRTLHARAEEAGRDPKHRERYDFVVARAVTEMRVLVEWMLPLTRVTSHGGAHPGSGGAAVAMKSGAADEEIASARMAAESVGGKLHRVERVRVPDTEIDRLLAVVQKVRPTPSRYPRAAAETKRAPL